VPVIARRSFFFVARFGCGLLVVSKRLNRSLYIHTIPLTE